MSLEFYLSLGSFIQINDSNTIYIQFYYKDTRMGPVVVAIAIGIGSAIAAKITADMVEDLKNQINRIVNQHKSDSDRLKALQQLLKKLDLDKVYEVMKKVSTGVSGSFKTFLVDQQERMKYITNVKLKEIGKEPLAGVFQNLMQMLNVVSSVMMAVEIAAATNPATIVISGIMLVLSGILGIFSTITNIMAIGELKKKKEELIEYFKAGGQFQMAQIKLKDSAIQVIKNLYMLIVNGKNMLKMLSARITLLQLEGSQLDYGASLRALQADPFDHGFQKLILATYLNFIEINNNQSLGLSAKISRIYTVLQSVMNSQNIPKKLQEFTNIISQFTEGTDIAKKIQSQYAFVHQLNSKRLAFAKRFESRSSQAEQKLVGYDQRLLKSIVQSFEFPAGTPQNKKNLHLAELVSYFTQKFYGDPNDKSGETLYGLNLKELSKKTSMLQYIDAFQLTNAFVLPQPFQGEERVDWTLKKNKLIQEFTKANKPADKVFLQFLYMRIQYVKNTVAGQQILNLNMTYGAQLKIRGDSFKYELSIQDLDDLISPQDITKARRQSYSVTSSILNYVTSPSFIKGVDFILDNKLQLSLQGLKVAAWLVKMLPEQQRHYRIGDRTVEEHVTDFKGISINLKEIKFSAQEISLKNTLIPLNTQKFSSANIDLIYSNILMFIMGICHPWRVQSIEITKNGNLYESVVQWSEDTNNKEFLGKVMNYKSINDTQDLKSLAETLRDQRKELFVVNVTAFTQVICWYLE